MTGKEALEELRFQVGNITHFTRDLQITTFKVKDSGLFEIIAKDLEVLEILKNNEISIIYIKDSLNYTDYIELCVRDYYDNLSHIKEDEYNKIKGWLNNDY